MEDLALITAVNHWVLLEGISLSLLEKIKMSFTSLGRSVLEKTVPSVLSAVLKTSGTAFPTRTDKWFLLLIFLVRSTHITLGYVVVKVSIHARPVDCFTCTSQAAFNSCVGTMKLFAYFGPQGKRYYTS